jgi:sugar phosphate isomerase/epimerase
MAYRSSITVNLIPEARQGPFVFHDDLATSCREAAELGFDAVELFFPGPEAVDEAELHSLLKDYNLKVSAFGTGAGWIQHQWTLTDASEAVREKAKTFLCSMLALASRFHAPAILGSMQGRHSPQVPKPQALDLLKTALQELGAYAEQVGSTLLYEPLNRYETNLVSTLGEGVELLRSVQSNHVKILADLFHMNIEEVSPARALVESHYYLGHVHFADTNRRAAGMGHFDYVPIRDALDSAGYTGYLAAEIFPIPDSLTAARQTIESFRKFFK